MTNHVHVLVTLGRGPSCRGHDERPGPALSAVRQPQLSAQRYCVGRAISLLSPAAGSLSPRLPAIRGTQPRSGGHPAQYLWSSYRANGQGEVDALVAPHALYLSLGRDELARQSACRAVFRRELEPGLVDKIRLATQGNTALGNARFAAQIASALGRRVTRGTAGRPAKAPQPVSGDLFADGE